MVHKGSFNVDVFGCEVKIIVADDLRRSLNWHFKKHNTDPITFEPAGYCINFDNESVSEYYVFFQRQYLDVNTVNHEKSHLVEFILNDRGIRASGEVRSYLDGFISQKIDQFFKCRKIKIKSEYHVEDKEKK